MNEWTTRQKSCGDSFAAAPFSIHVIEPHCPLELVRLLGDIHFDFRHLSRHKRLSEIDSEFTESEMPGVATGFLVKQSQMIQGLIHINQRVDVEKLIRSVNVECVRNGILKDLSVVGLATTIGLNIPTDEVAIGRSMFLQKSYLFRHISWDSFTL